MQAMMEEAERNHEALPFDPEAEKLSDRDLEDWPSRRSRR